MPFAMKEDVTPDPRDVGLLGTDTEVAHAQRVAHPIQQAGFGHSLAPSKLFLEFYFDSVINAQQVHEFLGLGFAITPKNSICNWTFRVSN
jgi:hypothetical protein